VQNILPTTAWRQARVRNEGYSLLYQLLSQESDAAKILILKHADLPIADIIKEGDCRPLGRLRDGGRSCESASSFEDSQSRPITIFAKCNQTRPRACLCARHAGGRPSEG